MKILLLMLLSLPAWSAGVLSLSSDKPVYTSGEQATLRAQLSVRPTDPNLAPFFKATLNGEPVETQVLGNAGFTVTEPLAAGSHSWQVQAYFEDKAMAKELLSTMEKLESRNEEIDELLAKETDLDVIAELEREKEQNLLLLSQVETQLDQNRKPIGDSATLSFSVAP
jgi:hypothetical protein